MVQRATNYYDGLFVRLIGDGVSQRIAVERVGTAYLDGKPLPVGKKKLTKKTFQELGREFEVCPFEIQLDAAADGILLHRFCECRSTCVAHGYRPTESVARCTLEGSRRGRRHFGAPARFVGSR